MDTNPPPTPVPPNPQAQGRFKWLLIVALFLAPAVVAFLSAMAKLDGVAVASPLLGGLLGGHYYGIRLARRFGASTYARILIGLFFGSIAACAIIGIGFAGCAFGGYTLRLG